MNELPSSWTATRLGEVCRVVRGITFPASAKQATQDSSNICCLRTTNIQREIDWNDIYFVPREYVKRDDQLIQVGDILMSMANSYELVGKVALVRQLPHLATFGAFLAAIKPIRYIYGQYLFYLIRTDQVQSDLRKGSSQTVNIANISLKALSGIETALAPFNEQKRIAAKLDALLARVDACRERLERVPSILKRFRQAILAAATSGMLTKNWKQDSLSEPKQPWLATTLGDCGSVSGGLTKNTKRNALPLKRPYLRVANVYANRLELNDVAKIGLTEAEFEKTNLVSGDLLIVEGNGSIEQIGRVALWNEEIKGCVHQNHLIRWRRKTDAIPKFVLFWLMSPKGRSSLMDLASTTTGLHTLSISKVSAVPIELPSLDEQHEIVHRVETLFTYADRLESRYKAAHDYVNRLTPALLAKAFRGELVPQDPNDEPASVLLERIRAARAQEERELRMRPRKPPSKPRRIAEVIMLKRNDITHTHLSDILKARGPLTPEALWSASQLDIDEFYDQLKDEEARGLLKEMRGESSDALRLLEAA